MAARRGPVPGSRRILEFSGPIEPTEAQEQVMGANGAPKVPAEPYKSEVRADTTMGAHFMPDIESSRRGADPKMTPEQLPVSLAEKILSGAADTVADPTFVTMEDRARFGIAEHEIPCWIRAPKWENGTEADRPGEFLNENLGYQGGARIIKHNGSYVHYGTDLILAVKHVDVAKAILERNQKLSEQFAAKAESDYSDDLYHGPDGEVLDMNNQRDLARLKKANQEAIDMMMQGSDTRGLSLDEAVSRKSVEEMREFSARNALAGSTRSRIANEVDRVVEAGKAASKGKGGTYAMGASFDKNGVLVR